MENGCVSDKITVFSLQKWVSFKRLHDFKRLQDPARGVICGTGQLSLGVKPRSHYPSALLWLCRLQFASISTALPSITKYYQVSVLSRVMDCWQINNCLRLLFPMLEIEGIDQSCLDWRVQLHGSFWISEMLSTGCWNNSFPLKLLLAGAEENSHNRSASLIFWLYNNVMKGLQSP